MAQDLIRLRIVVHPDPGVEAGRLATRTGAELVTDALAAEAAVRRRLAGGGAPPSGPSDLAPVGEGSPEADEANASPHAGRRPPASSDVARLKGLGERVDATRRVREQTEAEAVRRLATSIGLNARVAIHPDSLRAAGEALLDAEADLDRAQRLSGGIGDTPRLGSPPRDRIGLEEREPDNAETSRHGWGTAVVILMIGVGAGVLLLFSPVPAAAALPVAAAVGLVLVIELRAWRRARDAADHHAATANLARASDSADRGVASSALVATDLSLSEAQRQLVGARRAWESLVGPVADPHQLDAIVRSHDPRFAVAPALVRATPAARTALTVERRTLARWRVGWAEFGRSSPPPGRAHVELAHLEREATEHSRVIDLTDPHRWEDPGGPTLEDKLGHGEGRRGLVLVEPFLDLGVHRSTLLRHQLEQLPANVEVTIVVADVDTVPEP